MQNQSLREELAALKLETEASGVSSEIVEDAPPKYEEHDSNEYRKRLSSSSSESTPKDDDSDAQTIERLALTNSVGF